MLQSREFLVLVNHLIEVEKKQRPGPPYHPDTELVKIRQMLEVDIAYTENEEAAEHV